MTPKEKALDLVSDFYAISSCDINYGMDWQMARQCGLMTVDEILSTDIFSIKEAYWQEVKQEIEKL